MENDKKGLTEAPAPTEKPKAPDATPKSKWKYTGPKLRNGLFLSNGKMIVPGQIADADLEYYMERFPDLNQYFKAV